MVIADLINHYSGGEIMEGLYAYFLVIAVFILLSYGLMKQIKQTITIQTSDKRLVYRYKRALIGNYVTSISFLIFSILLMLNITNTLYQNHTALTSYVFLVILLISKFGVTPKLEKSLINR